MDGVQRVPNCDSCPCHCNWGEREGDCDRSLDYGTPPLGQSQRHLSANFNPGRIEFKCPQDPMDDLSAIGTAPYTM
ncbi:hypothetical protein M422DRAFT_28411 [Sphaerobolus stellatus SS14]|nr:hypothetical protein M422DRAFT_28411 [Sphaerobolus stellatus SS14]